MSRGWSLFLVTVGSIGIAVLGQVTKEPLAGIALSIMLGGFLGWFSR